MQLLADCRFATSFSLSHSFICSLSVFTYMFVGSGFYFVKCKCCISGGKRLLHYQNRRIYQPREAFLDDRNYFLASSEIPLSWIVMNEKEGASKVDLWRVSFHYRTGTTRFRWTVIPNHNKHTYMRLHIQCVTTISPRKLNNSSSQKTVCTQRSHMIDYTLYKSSIQ